MNYSNGFNPNIVRNYPAVYGNDLDFDYTLKSIINPNRPSTAPLKKDRGINKFSFGFNYLIDLFHLRKN